jgi:hypothetical protein
MRQMAMLTHVLRYPTRRTLMILLALGIYVLAYAAVRFSGLLYLNGHTLERVRTTKMLATLDFVIPMTEQSPLPEPLLGPLRLIFGIPAIVEGTLRPLGLTRTRALVGWVLLLLPLFVRPPQVKGGNGWTIALGATLLAAMLLLCAAYLERDPIVPIPTIIEPSTRGTKVPP